MDKHELIDPVTIRGNGECPGCGGSLIVVDQDVSVMTLNKDGIPITDDTSVKVDFICGRCGSKFPAVRDGMGYRLYTEASHLIRMAQIHREREEQLIAQRNQPKPDNPFVNIDMMNSIFNEPIFDDTKDLLDSLDLDDEDKDRIQEEIGKSVKSATFVNKDGKTIKWKNGVRIK